MASNSSDLFSSFFADFEARLEQMFQTFITTYVNNYVTNVLHVGGANSAASMPTIPADFGSIFTNPNSTAAASTGAHNTSSSPTPVATHTPTAVDSGANTTGTTHITTPATGSGGAPINTGVVHASGDIPTAAAAAGYTVETLGPDVTLGKNWQAMDFYGYNPAEAGVSQNSDGTAHLAGGGLGQMIESTTAYGGGGYFEATLSWDNQTNNSTGGWPSFWANDLEHMSNPDSTQNWIETDFMESFAPGVYGSAFHNWYGANGSGNTIDSNLSQAQTGADTSQPHKYGMLWVPATDTTQGYAKFYFDGQQVSDTLTWNKGNPALPDANNPFSVLDSRHLELFIGTGSPNPMTVYDVEVWQNGNANNIDTNSYHANPNPDLSYAVTTNLGSSGGATGSGGGSGTASSGGSGAAHTIGTPSQGVGTGAATDAAGLNNGSAGGTAAHTTTGQLNGVTITTVTGDSTGQFHVENGHIIDPNGNEFIARGINASFDSNVDDMLAKFPSLNFVRVPVWDFSDPSKLTDYVQQLTSKGIVVEIEDHSSSDGQNRGGSTGTIFSGGLLDQEMNWYKSIATAFKDNPYVWFGTNNEPSEINPNTGQTDAAALSAWQGETYNAIRETGNAAPIMLEVNSWGIDGTNVGYDPAVYAAMHNTIWDQHYYGWITNYSDFQSDNDQMVGGIAAKAQEIKSADGTMPVIIGEYGNSTTGETIDANGVQAVNAVLNSGFGSAAWYYNTGNPGDGLLDGGGGLSSYGQQVAEGLANLAAQTPTSGGMSSGTATAAPASTGLSAVASTTPAGAGHYGIAMSEAPITVASNVAVVPAVAATVTHSVAMSSAPIAVAAPTASDSVDAFNHIHEAAATAPILPAAHEVPVHHDLHAGMMDVA